MERLILHSDLNSFYASVETLLQPKLKGKAVAVAGSRKTGTGSFSRSRRKQKRRECERASPAGRRCAPVGADTPASAVRAYLKFSKLVREIYGRYTDRVEAFGMDESWLDLTGCRGAKGGAAAADEIRKTVREELGLTVSIGVSFNKVFAKLGSDFKKPDGTTVIGRSDFKEKIWPLPASDLLYVGRASARLLARFGIRTIGDIARSTPDLWRAFSAWWAGACGNTPTGSTSRGSCPRAGRRR